MASKQKEDLRVKEIPEIVQDPLTKKKYLRGKFLGKGGFAKCYELTDMDTKEIYAGKVVSKALLTKQHQKEKMTQEIAIHRGLQHRHIVGFHGFFEDDDNVYIILELCRRRSLMELHKRRKAVTEPETRYFVRQVVQACQYLHINKVIHRDLKLGNLFINDDMEIKIGDFGLATRVDYDGERKRTLCGTPNYIAPEVLGKKGHSYEVDVWSLGCIVYTLLVGKPPFETSCLKDTYMKIKKNEYQIPSTRVSLSARNLIQKLLRSDPGSRPNMTQILEDEFFVNGYLPPRLPTSCLTMAPRFASMSHTLSNTSTITRKPLLDVNQKVEDINPSTNNIIKKEMESVKPSLDGLLADEAQKQEPPLNDEPADCYLSELYSQLTSVVSSRPSEINRISEEDAQDPAAVPVFWISKWVDYSDKYGIGYQLSDNSVGVLFNDATKLLLNADGENVQYIERDGTEHFHTIKSFPEHLNKKITLLKYFRNYMNEHLLKAGASLTPREGDEISRLPCLKTWFRTRNAIILHLSNGTLQLNFFQDHTKVILCPLMGAVTYIDEKRNIFTYRFQLVEKFGCSRELASRLRYARIMVERIMAVKSGSGKLKIST